MKKEEMMRILRHKYGLVGYVLKFNVQKKKYFDLRRQFEITACKLRNRLSDYYSSTKYLGTILQNVPNMVAESLHEAIELAILVLSQHNVLITTEEFVEKYYRRAEYDIDYDLTISKVVERYADIIGEREALHEYRTMQEASRGRWEGGGFGLGGAVKGALMAGALNVGTDILRGVGKLLQKEADSAYIQEKVCDLKEEEYTQDQIVGGAYSAVIGIFNAVLNELRESGERFF